MSAGRLIVCPTPIGNLEDVTLRVLAALREADLVACEDTRRTRILLDRYGVGGKLVSYHEHNERARAERAGGADAGRARWWRSSPTPACRWSPTPASCSCGRAWRPGWGRGAARTVGGAERAGGQRAARRPLAVRRLSAAQARRARAGVRSRPRRWSRSSRRAGWRRRSQVLAGARSRAPGRGLPRADQDPRGDRPRHRRRARRPLPRRSRRAARSCS